MKHITVLQLKNSQNLLAFRKEKTCKTFIKKILPIPDKKQYRILKLEIQN